MKNCAFKHLEIDNEIPNKGIETELEMLTIEIKIPNKEIDDFLNVKEKELLESKVEIQQPNSKLTLELSDHHSDLDIMIRENSELKEKVKILETENATMKMRLVQEDTTHDTTDNETRLKSKVFSLESL